MQNSFNRVLSKMPKGKAKKAELRSAKPMQVKLGKIDELNDGYSAVLDELKSYLSPALKRLTEAKSYLYEIDEVIDRGSSLSTDAGILIENLNDLGVEVPSELSDIAGKLEPFDTFDSVQYLETDIDNIEEELSNIYQRFF